MATFEEVLSLLQARNRCLERLLGLCRAFGEQWVQWADETARDQGLARFQEKRTSHFHTLELYDRKISDSLKGLSNDSDPRNSLQGAKVDVVLAERAELVRAIIDQDNRIMGMLDSEKSRVLDELAAARRGQSLVNKFKSSWVTESGEGLDRKL
ncbi:MAG: hypothetical protein P4M08_15885 [Oligoflexia bacterium]|nr:hypothetical protein [Oligoflexia bacterium]